MQTACTVLAKLIVNKRLNTYRLVFSFDAHNRITVRNAVLVTGDICGVENENASLYIEQAISKAVRDLRCTNAQMSE